MGNGIFGDPGLLGVVWLGCVGIQILAWAEVALPIWLVILTFFGAVAPVVRLILVPFGAAAT